jgi:CBS domain-containing protein
MDIRSVMTRNPACCTQGTTLQEAARLMVQHDCGQIPVVDGARQPVGVITDRDIAIRGVAQGCDPATMTVGECMTSPVTTVQEDRPLEECCQLMEQNKIRRVVVVDGRGGISGIVAQADIALAARDATTAEVVKEVSEPGKAH